MLKQAARVLVGGAVLVAMGAAPIVIHLLPTGEEIRPVGTITEVGLWPGAIAADPNGCLLAIGNLGADRPSITILATNHPELRKVQEIPLPEIAGDLIWAASGNLYVSGGTHKTVSVFAPKPQVPGGTCQDHEMQAKDIFDVGEATSGIWVSKDESSILIASPLNGEVIRYSVRTRKVLSRYKTFGQPYRVAEVSGQIVASLFNESHLAIWNESGGALRQVDVGPRPSFVVPEGELVYVAISDGLDVVEVDVPRGRIVRRIRVADGEVAGSSPNYITLDRDGKKLYCTLGGLNRVVELDLRTGERLKSWETGWHPTAVLAVQSPAPNSAETILYVTSALGFGTAPNPTGQAARTIHGILESFPLSQAGKAQRAWAAPRAVPTNEELTKLRRRIQHIVLIVRENKTFDQIFGDLDGVEGDPHLTLYGDKITPNAHKLAREFTVFDHFYSNAFGSADGHAWLTMALANEYQQLNFRTGREIGPQAVLSGAIYSFPNPFPKTLYVGDTNSDWFKEMGELGQGYWNPSGVFGPRGQIFDMCAAKQISFRVYGEQLRMDVNGRIPPSLRASADTNYPGSFLGFLEVLDTDRATEFVRDFQSHGLAQFSYLTLPVDHTAGSAPGYYTPASFVADNDLATGQIIEALSKSKYWPTTLVFIVEDDPNSGSDHVNALRIPALAVGPAVKRGYVSRHQYSQVSILSTIEKLLGTEPLSIFDSQAPGLWDIFASAEDAKGFTEIPSRISMQRNPGEKLLRPFAMDQQPSESFEKDQWLAVKGISKYGDLLAYKLRKGIRTAAGDDDDRE